MTLHQFIKTISLIPDYLSDEHFRSQYRFVPYKGNKLGVNRIVKFENLPDELIEVLSEVDLNYKDEYQVNASKKNQSHIELTEKILKMLLKSRYEVRKDFIKKEDLFGSYSGE